LSQVTAEGGYTHYFLRKKDDDQQLAKDLERARAHVWQVRVRWNEGMAGKVTVRNHGFQVGQPASFDTEDAAPSALEFLLAAIAGAITVAFQWRLSRQGATVFALEVVAKAKSQNILYFLGVEDEGSPALDSVEVSVYVDADADADLLQRSLDETLQRCPVTRTLLQNCAVQTRLSIIGS
nr:OsmC family protein [Planctomycetota bacterium]